jgi:hypothetical protein
MTLPSGASSSVSISFIQLSNALRRSSLHLLPRELFAFGDAGIIISVSHISAAEVGTLISKLRNMVPVMVVGESMFSSSDIGLGRRRRRANKSCGDSYLVVDSSVSSVVLLANKLVEGS